ncbi:MAG: ABC transporter substrate-binding protein [Candidatus Hermodarchaeota archaeon]
MESDLSLSQSSKAPFIFGTIDSPNTIDPIDMWDTESYDVVCQSAEPLLDYNYSDPNYPIIPKLATSYYWHSPTEISFKIREGVYFHDGTLLTANVVQWNIERLMWFCNYTGTLPDNSTCGLAYPSSLYYFPDRVTPIFNNATVNSMYNVSIFLVDPYGPVLDLLTTPAMYILSPTSTPRYNYLDRDTDQIVGTGPFVFDYLIPGVEINYSAYENYWGGKPDIENLIFKIYSNEDTLNDALLVGQVDFIKYPRRSFHSTFDGDPDIELLNGGADLTYYYLEFYCGPGDPVLGNPWDYQILNSTWRRALSLAINYTFIWEDIQEGYANPGCPAIPRSMPAFNSSLDGKMAQDYPFGATFESNIKKAREYMQAMGFGSGWNTTYPGTNEADWTGASFRTIKADQRAGSFLSQDLNILFDYCWDLIGVDIAVTPRDWAEFFDTIEFTPWEIECSMSGWGADYLDPFDMLDPLFNNDSDYCFSRISDPWLKTNIESLISVTNPVARMNTAKEIQSYIFDITRLENPSSYCHTPMFVYDTYYAYHKDLTNFIPNSLERLYFYPCTWNRLIPILPGNFTLSSTAGSPDGDGIFDLTWTSSDHADNYSVYMHSKPISEINESLVLLTEGISAFTHPLSGLTDGIYYFMVEAWNENGTNTSNPLSVEIHIAGDEISIFDGLYVNQTWNDNGFITTLNFTYTHLIGDTYNVTATWQAGKLVEYELNKTTREISNVQGMPVDINGSHINSWIYPNTELGDYYLISVDGDGDHIFQVTGESTDFYTGYGMLDSWILTDITNFTGFAKYEKNTGLVLEANFSYYDGDYWYAVNLNHTNAVGILTPPGPFTLSSTAGTPDNDGVFDLTWTSATDADSYSVYEYNQYISEINGSLTLLGSGITALTLPLTGYGNGTYYFIVSAHNSIGYTLSDCLEVTVTIPPTGEDEPEIPGYNLFFIIMILGISLMIYLIRKYWKQK